MSNIQDQIKSLETSLAAMKHHAAGGAIQYKTIKQPPMDCEWTWRDYSSHYFDLSLYEYQIKPKFDPKEIAAYRILVAASEGKEIEWHNKEERRWEACDVFEFREKANLLQFSQYYRIKP